jgi:hypothetical protein
MLKCGTGMNTAVLAVTYGNLVRLLPYADPSRLMIIQRDVPLEELDGWRRRLRSVDDLAAFATADHALHGPVPWK